jgi:glycosyltransferase involved in cell wall biosynthesis
MGYPKGPQTLAPVRGGIMRKKILLVGPLLTRSGYGEQARFALRALRSRPDLFEVFIQPLQWGKTSWLNEHTEEREWIDQIIEKTIHHLHDGGEIDMTLQVTIPNEWQKGAPINIGYTAGMETTNVDHTWLLKANETIDRIIVVSNHSKNVFQNSTYKGEDQRGMPHELKLLKPIKTVNYPVKEYEELPSLDLDIPTDFNFLLVAQLGPRKNVHNTIKWFMEEFKDENVGLVIKANLMKNCLMDRLQTLHELKAFINQLQLKKDAKCKVYLIHGDMTDEEMHSLYKHPKMSAFITLSHGEGFGLPIFEAAYSGLPIVATGWSGQLDFLVDKKKKENFYNVSFDLQPIPKEVVWKDVIPEGTMWAYPREQSAKEKMRQCYVDNNKTRQKRWATYAKSLKKEFTEEKLYKQFVEGVLGEEIVEVKTTELPKVSIITSVYKGDEYIRPFLDDLTRQTIFQDKCELILVNANSPGNEEEVILEYQEKYPENIIYKKLTEDPGIYGSWNIGVKLATGEYLTNANLDDRRSPLFIETLAKQLYLNKEIDVVYSENYLTFAPNETFENNSSNGQTYPAEEFSLEGLLRGNPPHCMPMWRKSLHDTNGLFNDEYRSAGDWEFWLRCAFNGAQFKKYQQPLGLYYFNPQGVSTNTDNETWKQEEERSVFKKYQKIYMENQPK